MPFHTTGVQSEYTSSSDADWSSAVVTWQQNLYSRQCLRLVSGVATLLRAEFAHARQGAPINQRNDIKRTQELTKSKPKQDPAERFEMVLETISRIIKVQLPAYLKKLPLPESIGGFTKLTGKIKKALRVSVMWKMTSWTFQHRVTS